jgi:hypothetical protein
MDSSDVYKRGVTDDGAEALQSEALESIDCYVVGARTYEHALVLGWPYGKSFLNAESLRVRRVR